MHEFPPSLWPLSNYPPTTYPWALFWLVVGVFVCSIRVSGTALSCLLRIALLFLVPLRVMWDTSGSSHDPGRNYLVAILLLALWLIVAQAAVRAFRKLYRSAESRSDVVRPVFTGIAIGVFFAFMISPPPSSAAREAAPRTQCKNNLKQIGLALHSYHDISQMFPTPVQPKFDRSWRVTILPFMQQEALYLQYDQEQTWDSKTNAPLALERVRAFDCPGRPNHFDKDDRFLTAYSALTGPRAAFEQGEFLAIRDFTGGTSNTLMVAETCGKKIVWTEPRDVDLTKDAHQVNAPGNRLHLSDGIMSSYHGGGAQVLLADGSVRFISEQVDPKTLDAVLTRDDKPRLPGLDW